MMNSGHCPPYIFLFAICFLRNIFIVFMTFPFILIHGPFFWLLYSFCNFFGKVD